MRPPAPDGRWRAVITSPLEPELLGQLRRGHGAVDFVYPDALLAPARYPAHHPTPEVGDDIAARAEWEALLDGADILFDFGPRELQTTLASRPRLRWIQATSAGVGPLVERIGLGARAAPEVTTASGVHARPLAEFALFGMLWVVKDGPRLLSQQRRHRWQRTSTGELSGRTVLVVGMGRVGGAIAADCRTLGMRTIGCTRRPRDGDGGGTADTVITPSALDEWLPAADVLVLACPLTPATRHLIDARRLALLPRGAILVNVGRGACVDEVAMIAALEDGHLAGAALDVVEEEPLAPTSPLWELPQVLISPHSASTVAAENARIVAIFDDNLGRFQRGEPLRNRLDTDAGY